MHKVTLLNILLKKLILNAIWGMFLNFESQAHPHVGHLEILLQGLDKKNLNAAPFFLAFSCFYIIVLPKDLRVFLKLIGKQLLDGLLITDLNWTCTCCKNCFSITKGKYSCEVLIALNCFRAPLRPGWPHLILKPSICPVKKHQKKDPAFLNLAVGTS